jgi:hypothetical protein
VEKQGNLATPKEKARKDRADFAGRRGQKVSEDSEEVKGRKDTADFTKVKILIAGI